jgi:hypothetical protein
VNVALREHFRSNVIGYVALFLFAVSSSAQALPGKNQVDSGDIRNRQVKVKDLAFNSVGSRTVIDGSVTGADLSPSVLKGLSGPAGPKGATGPIGLQGPAGGVAEGSVKTAALADGSVTTPKLAGDAVTTAKLAAGAVTGASVFDNSLTGQDLATSSVGSAEVAADAVGATEITDSSIDGGEIVNGSLGAVELSTSSVGSEELATGAVTDVKIGSNAVNGSKVANNSLTSADIAGTDVNGTIQVPTGTVANGRCGNYSVGVGGTEAGEAVVITNRAALQTGLLIYGSRVPTDGTVTMTLCNMSGGTQAALVDFPIRIVTFG